MKYKVLEILRKEKKFVSGEQLSDICNVSRTAIWKYIKSLQTEGYHIESQHGLGYRLQGKDDSWNRHEILQTIEQVWFANNGEIFCYDTIDSTNVEAKRLIQKENITHGAIVIAEEQTAGKGRLGRLWQSQQTKGIWFSFILQPQISILQVNQISFVMAVAVCQALRKNTGVMAEIKWPNDILIDGKKVCGILIELMAEVERVDYLIVGIGVNVNQTQEDFSQELQNIAQSIFLATEKKQDRLTILGAILEEIHRYYTLFLQEGFPIIGEHWLRMNCIVNQEVTIIDREQIICQGVAQGLDQDGALLIQTKDGIERVICGDVSLRRTIV